MIPPCPSIRPTHSMSYDRYRHASGYSAPSVWPLSTWTEKRSLVIVAGCTMAALVTAHRADDSGTGSSDDDKDDLHRNYALRDAKKERSLDMDRRAIEGTTLSTILICAIVVAYHDQIGAPVVAASLMQAGSLIYRAGIHGGRNCLSKMLLAILLVFDWNIFSLQVAISAPSASGWVLELQDNWSV